MLSRQSNYKTLDFHLLEEEIMQREQPFQLVFLCRRLNEGLRDKVNYSFYMLKCMYHLATARACIVDTYCIPVSILKHRKELVIVQIWHALGAIKKFGYQSLDTFEGRSSAVAQAGQMHKNYSYVTCASEATKEFYAQAFNVPLHKIFVDGMPRIDYIIGSDVTNYRIRERVYKRHPQLRKKKNILYAPTFRKDVKVDLEPLLREIDPRKYNLIVKLHPLDDHTIPLGFALLSNLRTFDLLKVSDYIITDYSGVAMEASVLNKPLFFYVYDIEDYNVKRGLNINPLKECEENAFRRFSDLMAVIDSGYYNYEQLKTFCKKYVHTADSNNCLRIVNRLFEAMGIQETEHMQSFPANPVNPVNPAKQE